MSWRDVADAVAVAQGTVCVVECDGRRVALCRTASGIFAVEDRCSHDGEPLDQAELFGDEIECPRHGARFDVRTGKVRRLPAVRPIKAYEAREADGRIQIDIPAPEQPAPRRAGGNR